MIKNISLIIAISLIYISSTNAQQDIVKIQLKNGDIVEGNLLKVNNRQTVNVEIGDSVWVYNMGDISTMTKIKEDKGYKEVKYDTDDNKFYFGLSGASFPVGLGRSNPYGMGRSEYYVNANTGGFLMIDFGYLFSKYIGVAAQVSGVSISSVYEFPGNLYYSTIGLGLTTFTAGPLFSIKMGSKLEYTLRPTVGYSLTTSQYIPEGSWLTPSTYNSQRGDIYGISNHFALEVGTTLRYKFQPQWSATLSLEYLYTNADFHTNMDEIINQATKTINVISVGMGLAYSF